MSFSRVSRALMILRCRYLGCNGDVVVESIAKLHLVDTHGLHSSSFMGLPYRILNMNPKRNYHGADG